MELLVRESTSEDLARSTQSRNEQGRGLAGAIGRIAGRDLLAGPIDEHLFPGHMGLPHRGLQSLAPLRIALSEPAVLQTRRIIADVLLPKQSQGDVGPAKFRMNVAPIGKEQRRCPRLTRRGDRHPSGFEFGLAHSLRQRPAQAGCFRPEEIVAYGAGGHPTAEGDFAYGACLPSNPGTALLRRREPVAAAQQLEGALSLRPEHLPSCNNLAEAHCLAGLPELAAAAYREVLQRDPANVVARQSLAALTKSTAEARAPQSGAAQEQSGNASGTRGGVAVRAQVLAPPPPGAEGVPQTVPPVQEVESHAEIGVAPDDEVRAIEDLLRELPHATVERRCDGAANSW